MITLVKNEETFSDNKEISETLNKFFSEVVINLNLPQYDDPTVNVDDIDDLVARQSKNIRIIHASNLSERIIETQIILFTLRKFQRKKLRRS